MQFVQEDRPQLPIDDLVRIVLNELAAPQPVEAGRKKGAKFWIFFPRDDQTRTQLNSIVLDRLRQGRLHLATRPDMPQDIITVEQDGDTYHFLVRGDSLIVGTSAGSEASAKVLKEVQGWREIVSPFLEGYAFRRHVHNYLANMGLITGYSAVFKPFRTYTGYGITMRLWGARSDDILSGIKTHYTVTPVTIEAEVRLGEAGGTMKVLMSNSGRVRISTGDVTAATGLLNYYLNITREAQSSYEYAPLRDVVVGETSVTELTEEFVISHSSSHDRMSGWTESQLRALRELVVSGGLSHGFMGYMIDQDSANIVDLRERKLLMMTLMPDGVKIVARNPSSAQESIKRLHRQISLHVDPYVETVVRPMVQG